MYSLSLKLWRLGFEKWMRFVPMGTIFYKSTLVWKMACHRFSDKPLSKRVLTSPLPLKMPCVWRRPFCPCQKFNQNTTTNISHNINLFQTQNMKQHWQKRSGKGRNMILIRSGKGRNMILIRAQLNWEKILLIADRAQINRLLVLWRAWQERVGRDKSVSRAQLDCHYSGEAAWIKSPPLYPRSARSQCLRNYIGTSAFADVSYLMADVEANFYV